MNEPSDISDNASVEELKPYQLPTEPIQDFVVKVLLSAGGRMVDFLWNGVRLNVGDNCVVEEQGRVEFGSVSLSKRPLYNSCPKKAPQGKILRKATEADIQLSKKLAEKEKAALVYCKEKAMELGLKMSVSKANYSFDEKKAVFYFTAESRVDFRELVKELNNFTKVKVELRQVGVRDKAKILGGCGPCGSELCCSGFLPEFVPVSIRMAKNQFLALSPEKISGVCGRLLCCLSYENDVYKELQKKAPKLGKMVDTYDGKRGKVTQLNLLTDRISLSFEDGTRGDFNINELGSGPPAEPRPVAARQDEFPQPFEARSTPPVNEPRERKSRPSPPRQTEKPKSSRSGQRDFKRKRPADINPTPAAKADDVKEAPATGEPKGENGTASRRRRRRGRRRTGN
ncbi:MAG: regulatory iron-sulfur-containing complex subunit RicT [Nitrospinota bacterium]|nr:regulatory iron-sulfur-containing complex subunit RicT [Nitrospinota bacterium]MDH5677080.1 regulatory iron-sulfur-containing complex subunit RicT [Nitrospinota bacterium]